MCIVDTITAIKQTNIQDLFYKPYDFLAEDGTARFEVNFKITEGTMSHFTRNHLADEASDSSGSDGSSSSNTSDTADTSDQENHEDSGNVPGDIDGF